SFHANPGSQSMSRCIPNQYCLMVAGSVRAAQSFSGVVRMYVTYMKVDLFIAITLQKSLEVVQRPQARLLELADPALVDFLQWHGIEEVQLFPAAPHGRYEIRRLEDPEVLRDRLARHVQVRAQVAERLTVMRVQEVEALTATGVGQRLEQQVGVIHSWFRCEGDNSQVNTCMSSTPTGWRNWYNIARWACSTAVSAGDSSGKGACARKRAQWTG